MRPGRPCILVHPSGTKTLLLTGTLTKPHAWSHRSLTRGVVLGFSDIASNVEAHSMKLARHVEP